jgi:hypothetical protein
LEEADLCVGVEAGEHAGGVVVEHELAAELQVKLVAAGPGPLDNGGGLLLDVLFVVKTGA